MQRLEEQERRLRAEKDRRMKQAQEALRLEQDAAQKIAARAFAKAYLQDLVPSVFNNLRENGYFYDPVEHGIEKLQILFLMKRFVCLFFLEIETSFMPWLMEKTMAQVNQLVLGRTILDSIIRDTVNQRIDDYDKLLQSLQEVESFILIYSKNKGQNCFRFCLLKGYRKWCRYGNIYGRWCAGFRTNY